MTNGIAQFEARVARMVSENNLEALEELRGKLIVIQETRRVKFGRTRDVNTGKLYRAVGVQLGIVNNALRSLKSKAPLDEAGFKAALGDMVKQGVQNAKDKVVYGAGKQFGLGQQARGRLDLNYATKELSKAWYQYVGREAAAGDEHIKTSPTIRNLMDFLDFAYGFKVSDEDMMKIVGNGNQPPASPEGTNPKADVKAREALGALKKTSPQEYATLKSKFGAPTPGATAAAPKTESVVMEGPLENATFDPKALFPRLANVLIRNGMIQIKRDGDKTLASKAGDGNGKGGAGGETQTASARVTSDGHSIDIGMMKNLMMKDEITGADMTELKHIVAAGPQGYSELAKNEEATKTMASLVVALLKSIRKKNDPGAIQAAHSITTDGHTMDINLFSNALKEYGVTGEDLNAVRSSDINKGGTEKLMQVLSDPRNPHAKVIFNIARAATAATGKPE
jgi:hypothetical protein